MKRLLLALVTASLFAVGACTPSPSSFSKDEDGALAFTHDVMEAYSHMHVHHNTDRVEYQFSKDGCESCEEMLERFLLFVARGDKWEDFKATFNHTSTDHDEGSDIYRVNGTITIRPYRVVMSDGSVVDRPGRTVDDVTFVMKLTNRWWGVYEWPNF